MRVSMLFQSGTEVIIYPEDDSVVITSPHNRMLGGPNHLTLNETLELLEQIRKEKGEPPYEQ